LVDNRKLRKCDLEERKLIIRVKVISLETCQYQNVINFCFF